MKTLVLINFKQTDQEKVLSVIGDLNEIALEEDSPYRIAIVVQPEIAHVVNDKTQLPIFIHDMFLDDHLYNTLNPNYVEMCNIKGVLTNHPQKKIAPDILLQNCFYARKRNLEVIIGCTGVEEAIQLQKYIPNYLLIENIDLIGKSISIKQACPEMIEKAVSKTSCNVIFGAGIRSIEDIQFIIDTGGVGVVLASLIIGAEYPAAMLRSILPIQNKSIAKI